MLDYTTKAIVINRFIKNDFDENIILYTEKFGKINAKIKSSRKITSKISPHLKIGSLILSRIFFKDNPLLIDAISYNFLEEKNKTISKEILNILNYLLESHEKDEDVWREVFKSLKSENSKKNILRILKILGYDPLYSFCNSCGQSPDLFTLDIHSFYCHNCYNYNNINQNSSLWEKSFISLDLY